MSEQRVGSQRLSARQQRKSHRQQQSVGPPATNSRVPSVDASLRTKPRQISSVAGGATQRPKEKLSMFPWSRSKRQKSKLSITASFAVGEGDLPSQYYNEDGLQMRKDIGKNLVGRSPISAATPVPPIPPRTPPQISGSSQQQRHHLDSATPKSRSGFLRKRSNVGGKRYTRRGTAPSMSAFRKFSGLGRFGRSSRATFDLTPESLLRSPPTLSTLSSTDSRSNSMWSDESSDRGQSEDGGQQQSDSFWNREQLNRLLLSEEELKLKRYSHLEKASSEGGHYRMFSFTLESEPSDPIPAVPHPPSLPRRLPRSNQESSSTNRKSSIAPLPPAFQLEQDDSMLLEFLFHDDEDTTSEGVEA